MLMFLQLKSMELEESILYVYVGASCTKHTQGVASK